MEERNLFNTTLLICPLIFQLFQIYEAFIVAVNTHTHTHTHNTHTHTHTHTYTHDSIHCIFFIAIHCNSLHFFHCFTFSTENFLFYKARCAHLRVFACPQEYLIGIGREICPGLWLLQKEPKSYIR